MEKNYNRDPFTFANINLLGKCNVDCFFCLGKDIEDILCKQNQLGDHFSKWNNFDKFIEECKANNIKKIYLTGQNTDPTLYNDLPQLINFLQEHCGFSVGIRTNGFIAKQKMSILQTLKDEIGFSIHTVNPITQKMMLNRTDIPDWDFILKEAGKKNGGNVRVSMVLNRCNEYEFFDILKFLKNYKDYVRYIQVRRVSTDTREAFLKPDVAAYERVYTQVNKIFPVVRKFVTDAEEYDIYGMKVTFWRTIKTSVNSINYFTDGTISKEYFIIEGYLKNYKKEN